METKVAAISKGRALVDSSNLSARMARFYWENQSELSGPRSLESSLKNGGQALENPLVLGSIAAGVLGVILIALIILGVWLRSRFNPQSNYSTSHPQRERDTIDGDTEFITNSISISMSTLDDEGGNDNNCETTMESINLNDTTFYSAVELPSDSSFDFEGEIVSDKPM